MLSTESLQLIEVELAKYPADQRRSAVMAALRIAQVEKSYLKAETIEFVANYIGIAPVAAYEVATFYNMYDLSPVGRYKFTVCTNLPCALRGGADAKSDARGAPAAPTDRSAQFWLVRRHVSSSFVRCGSNRW